MWGVKQAMLIVLCVCFVPIYPAKADDAVSGRELLRAIRERGTGPKRPARQTRSARTPADTKHPTVPELLDKYAAGQQGLQSFIVKGTSFRKGRSDQAPKMMGLPGVFRFRYDSEFEGRFDANRASVRTRLWGQVNPRLDVSKEQALYQSRLWDGKTFFQYDTSSMAPAGVCYIVKSEKKNRERDRPTTTIQSSGNRFMLGYLPFTDDRIDSVIRNGKSMTVRNAMEQVRGSPCYVIDADTKYGRYTICLDPQHGYNIARATIKKSPGNLLMQAGSYTLGEGEVYSFSFETLRFEQREGLWIPMESESRDSRIFLGGGFDETLMYCKVSSIVLNPDHDALGSFVPDDIKDGARVSVDTAPGIKYTWQNGQVVDVEGRKVNLGPNKPQPEGLAGKPLPDLKGLGIDLDPNRTKDRPILMCFFDMNQRPSRHTVTELVKKTQELREQGVVVVCVHASKVDPNTLDKWAKDNNVPFAVGMIQANEEKTRFAWGVKSLPWLILADRKHIVVAEGFGIEELDDKIEEIENSKK